MIPDGYVYGLDISHWNTGIDWKGHYESGARFVWVHCLYGTHIDADAKLNVAAAREHGLEVGLYQFWRMVEGDDAQLDAMVERHRSCEVGDGDLAPMLDIETDPGVSELDAAWRHRVDYMMERLTERFGSAYLYGPESGLRTLGWPPWPLWVAKYPLDGKPRWPPIPLRCPDSANVVGQQFGVGVGLGPSGEQRRFAGRALDRDILRKPLLRIRVGPELPGPAPAVPLTEEELARQAALVAAENRRG